MIPYDHTFNLNTARECDQLVDLTKQTVTECKTELEKLRNSDQKENQPNDKEIFNCKSKCFLYINGTCVENFERITTW